MRATDYAIMAKNFERLRAVSQKGGQDVLDRALWEFAFEQSGPWSS